MARIGFATVCCVASLLAIGRPAVADEPCAGIVIIDVLETPSGALTPVGERCYERGPGVPFYYDAPTTSHPFLEQVVVTEPSLTNFDVSVMQALGAVSIQEIIERDPIFSGVRHPRAPEQ